MRKSGVADLNAPIIGCSFIWHLLLIRDSSGQVPVDRENLKFPFGRPPDRLERERRPVNNITLITTMAELANTQPEVQQKKRKRTGKEREERKRAAIQVGPSLFSACL